MCSSFKLTRVEKSQSERTLGVGGDNGVMGARTWKSVVSKSRPPSGGGYVICESSLKTATVVEVVLW